MTRPPFATLCSIALVGLLAACGGGGGGAGGGEEPPVVEVDPPVVTQQPASASVTVGATASFSVAATGEGVLAYQWQLSENDGGSWADLGGATGTDYTTPATTLDDDGDRYRCVVTNDGGSTASAAAILTVGPVPPWRHTITIDGGNDFQPGEGFPASDDGIGFLTWDDDYVYVGVDSPLLVLNSPDDWFTVYVGGPSGTTTGVAYGPQQPDLAFSARYHVRIRADGGAAEALEWNGAAWVDAGWDLTGDWMGEETYLELRIALVDVGSPTNLVIHLAYVSDVDMAEITTVGVPDVSFTSGLDPDYAAWYEFDFQGTDAPNLTAPQP